MEDVLARTGAVREEEVDALAAQAGGSQAGGDAPRQRPHRDGRDLVDLGDPRGGLTRADQGGALVDRMQVEERDRVASLCHEARLLTALDDAAKNASRVVAHVASSFMAFASACAPRAASPIDANSRGVCDPPVEGTKIMPGGTPQSAEF